MYREPGIKQPATPIHNSPTLRNSGNRSASLRTAALPAHNVRVERPREPPRRKGNSPPSSGYGPDPALRGKFDQAAIRTLVKMPHSSQARWCGRHPLSGNRTRVKPACSRTPGESRPTASLVGTAGKIGGHPTNNRDSTLESQPRPLPARPRMKRRAGPAPFAPVLDNRHQHNRLQKRRLRPRRIIHTLNESATAVHGTARAKEEDARGLVPLTPAPNHDDHRSSPKAAPRKRTRRAKPGDWT